MYKPMKFTTIIWTKAENSTNSLCFYVCTLNKFIYGGRGCLYGLIVDATTWRTSKKSHLGFWRHIYIYTHEYVVVIVTGFQDSSPTEIIRTSGMQTWKRIKSNLFWNEQCKLANFLIKGITHYFNNLGAFVEVLVLTSNKRNCHNSFDC